MELEANSQRLLGITRAKGKMYEFRLEEEHHLSLREGDEPDALLLPGIAILGDAAAYLSDPLNEVLPSELLDQLELAARYFDAFLESKFEGGAPRDLAMLASASYYLADRPGSSTVLANRLVEENDFGPLDATLEWILKGRFREEPPNFEGSNYDDLLNSIASETTRHFQHGGDQRTLLESLDEVRNHAYSSNNSRDVLFADLMVAIMRFRLSTSVWETIPSFTGQSAEQWRTVLEKPSFPMELWPSQLLIGQAGLMRGVSGAIQTPTSAGKTRAIEMLLRSAFISGRANLAVVVAPFRALTHEIGTSLRNAFLGEDTKVNELSDALQFDFEVLLTSLMSSEIRRSPAILVLTPEKLHFVLRQAPEIATRIGLIIYDECHQFDTGSRGVTYELLLAEIAQVLPENAQSVLISAVMPNALLVAHWLLGPDAQVVDGTSLMPTSRAIAFVSWHERRGRLDFFDSSMAKPSDYFVPRAVESHELELRPRETAKRSFPTKGKDAWKDVSLYLGIRLAPSGAVAVFCGQKATANGMARRAAEIYSRGFQLEAPVQFSDPAEVDKLRTLTEMHFGTDSSRTIAANLGIFVHHGTTPHGLRIAIEYAMQKSLIRLVVCTSTLAQGVNLPIRYLIVSGTRQAGDAIRARDFQNLLGRAGRAGMHTEGLVIFANPELYERRKSRPAIFSSAVDLLSAENVEDTGSSLLESLAPIRLDGTATQITVDPEMMVAVLLAPEPVQQAWASQTASAYPDPFVTPKALLKILSHRREILSSVESYLMANRGDSEFEYFKSKARELSERTLAFALASTVQRIALALLFEGLATHINEIDPSPEHQAQYARTLLGSSKAKEISDWVSAMRDELEVLTTPDEWLLRAWPLFSELSDHKFFKVIKPEDTAYLIAQSWLNGDNYRTLAKIASERSATKPWGNRRRAITEDEIFTFCQQTLSFDCSLIVSAIGLFLGIDQSESPLSGFLKSLKYGLPDQLSTRIYEYGLSDRAIALKTRNELIHAGYEDEFFEEAWATHQQIILDIISSAPSYFASALSSMG